MNSDYRSYLTSQAFELIEFASTLVPSLEKRNPDAQETTVVLPKSMKLIKGDELFNGFQRNLSVTVKLALRIFKEIQMVTTVNLKLMLIADVAQKKFISFTQLMCASMICYYGSFGPYVTERVLCSSLPIGLVYFSELHKKIQTSQSTLFKK